MARSFAKSHHAAVALALGLALAVGQTPAAAADLGGDCCADLEERIAELEATTARKGNRKVSLTISGYVAEQITFWDDGHESNAYLWGMGPTQASHFKLNGQATFSPGWTAGYMVRLQVLSPNPFLLNQNTDDSVSDLNVQMSYWYLASKDLGKIAVGKNAQAAKSAVMFTDQSGTQIIANYVLFDAAGFFLRNNGALSNVTWGQLGYCYSQARPWGGDCNGIVMSGIRYDSPVFKGFSASASWGEDDFWEVAGRYSGEIGGFKLAFGIGYSVNEDENEQGTVSLAKDSEYFQAGGYIQHLATGLFVHAAYGSEENNDTLLLNGRHALDGEHWYVKAGIRKKWSSLGHTVFFGEYAEYLDQLGPAALASGATSSEFVRWGGGIVQEIDAAAMSAWLKYRQHEADVEGGTLTNLEDARFLGVGAMISF